MSTVTPNRVTVARQLRGLTKADVAKQVGVSAATITYWEKGEREPEPQSVHRLADVLRVPLAFFYGEAAPQITPDSVSFRSLRTLSRQHRDRACAAAEIASMLGHWIAERYELPAVNIPDLSGLPAAVAAVEMRQHLRLGSGALPSMLHLLEASGVRAFAMGVDVAKADALSAWIDGTPLVLFNTTKSAERSRNDAAHELGHLCMHRHKAPSGDKAEQDAIEFAAELLVPSESLRRQAPHVASLSALLTLKKAWRVSAGFMLKRLVTMDMISDWSARALWQRLAANGFRSGEPDGMAREHSPVLTQLVQHVRSQHAERAFTFIASETALSAADVRALIVGLLPLTSSEGGDPAIHRMPASVAAPHLQLVR